MTVAAADLGGVALVITALGGFVASVVAAIAALRLQRPVAEARDATRMSNGIPVGTMLELNEGRRIATEVPPAERTASDQEYVTKVEAHDATNGTA